MLKALAIGAVAASALVGTMPNVFAATTSTSSSPQMVVVQQGPGYTVTAPASGSEKPVTGSLVTPLDTTTYDLSPNSSGDFGGETIQSYNGGSLVDSSSIDVKDVHNTFSDDYLYANGGQEAEWTGTSPTNATKIYMTPQEIADATGVQYAVSIPAGISFNSSSDTATLTWQEATVSNNWQGDYTWGQWETEDAGLYNDVHTNDEATFEFGSQNIGMINTVMVDIG